MSLSTPPPAPDVLAVAFVIESSISIAQAWRRIVFEYVSPMLKRLGESHQGYKLRLGIVTYATADTVPSPLLCKRFFTDYQLVFKEMNDISLSSKLGIGQTGSGGSRGMAALEGLVAAVELFDILRECSPTKAKPNIFHIFHVASAPPDASKNPVWNESQTLDYLSWDNLPSELRKRNINLSCINILPQPKFSELHAAAVAGEICDPWFNKLPADSILLSGFATPKAAKRLNENSALDRSNEAKRPRLGHGVEPSPKLPVKSSPKSSSILIPTTSLPPQPRLQAPTAVPQPTQNPPPNMPHRNQQMHIMDRIRAADEQLRNIEAQIKNAIATGNTELAETLTQDYARRNLAHQKFKQAVAAYAQSQQMAARQQAQSQLQKNNGQVQDIPGSNPTTVRPTPSPSLVNKDLVAASFAVGIETNVATATAGANIPPIQPTPNLDAQAINRMLHNRSLSNSNFPPVSINQVQPTPPQTAPASGHRMNMSIDVSTQMQKLLEQNIRAPGQPTGAGNVSFGMQSENTEAGSSSVPNPEASHSGEPAKGHANFVWSGALKWNGIKDGGKKEMHTFVVATVPDGAVSHAEMWPPIFNLVPILEPAVNRPDFQRWIKRFSPVICTFQPHVQNASDSKPNQHNYTSLVQLLTNKNIYAVAAWPLKPNETPTNNALIFPINRIGLMGAVFPSTGIPELPKPSGVLQPQLPTITPPPALAARLQQMSPEQRNMLLAEMERRQKNFLLSRQTSADPGVHTSVSTMQQQHHQQQQQLMQQALQQNLMTTNPLFSMNSLQSVNANGLNPMNMHTNPTGLNPMNPMEAGHPMTAGLPRPVGVGAPSAMAGNVSYEMLQSFMQRSAEGAGMGPN